MKNILKIAAIASMLMLYGCKSEPVCDTCTPLGGFNDKTYIWQTWSISTNDVDVSMLK